jgi:hypothetical protein
MSIVTRPSVTTDVCTVQPHRFDVETGYSENTFTSYVRIGSGDPRIEYDLTPPSSQNGDTAVGIKEMFGYTDRAQWGASAQMSFPTGAPAVTAGHSQYDLNANVGYTLSPALSLSSTIGFDAFAFVPSIDLSATLTPNDALFVEYAYFSRAGIGLPGKSQFDGGFIHDLNAHVQFDVEYGFSPTLILGQRSHYVGAGLSFMN